MKRPIVSTLVPALLETGRGVGNSTRQVNYAIDMAYKGYEVLVRDHYENGENHKANKFLFERVMKVLRNHRDKEYFNVDIGNCSFWYERPSPAKSIVAWCPIVNINLQNTTDKESIAVYDFVEGDYKCPNNEVVAKVLEQEGNIMHLKDRPYAIATHKMLQGTFLIY